MKKEFVELFENSRNPIEDDKVIEEIASAYIRDGWFYDEIVKIGADDKKTQEYPIQDMNILYSTLFNIWKKNIKEESEKYGISSKNFAFSKEFEKEIVENTDIER